MDDESERCARCGRESIDPDEFVYGASMYDADGNVVYVCEGCITPEEQHERAEEEHEWLIVTVLDADRTDEDRAELLRALDEFR